MLNALIDTWSSALSPWSGRLFQLAMPNSAGQHAGSFIAGRFDADFDSLRYKIFIPSTYGNAPLALIVMLHGCGQDADDFARGTRMNELAERAGCLVVYPEQRHGANWSRCWNWFEEANHHRGQGEPGLIAGLTREIMSAYTVDPAHVSVAGFSCGAAMALTLGHTYPDLFNAVGCHSGLPRGCATDSHGAMAVMRDGAALHTSGQALTSIGVPVISFHG